MAADLHPKRRVAAGNGFSQQHRHDDGRGGKERDNDRAGHWYRVAAVYELGRAKKGFRHRDENPRRNEAKRQAAHAGLSHAPLFSPSVGNFYNGMLVHVPVFTRLLEKKVDPAKIRTALQMVYAGEPYVSVKEKSTEDYLDGAFLSPLGCNGTNRVDLFVSGHEDQVLITARLDNLGKGASGAAVQNMNIMLGADEGLGLSD